MRIALDAMGSDRAPTIEVEGAVAALDSKLWEFVTAEERPRAVTGTGVDAVIRARRRT